ncbi:MAG: undecaprenyl-diphosphate phosphatase [Armatimonadaceae bacterium]
MDWIKVITLGVVQGITEWLPISSTAHLKIIPSLLHWPDPGAPATAVMQLGTVAAVIVYFWKDIRQTLLGMFRALGPGGDRNSPEARLAFAVAVGTLPICVAALFLKDYIVGPFRSDYVIAGALIVVGLILLAAEKFLPQRRSLEEITVRDGLIVGIAQMFSLIPGASRSGSTLTGAFASGLQRDDAVRFSFLLSIPAVTLAGLYEMKEFIKPEPPLPGALPVMAWSAPELIVATVISGLVGYASIAFLLQYLKKHSTLVFVLYRVVLGFVLLYLLQTGQLMP